MPNPDKLSLIPIGVTQGQQDAAGNGSDPWKGWVSGRHFQENANRQEVVDSQCIGSEALPPLTVVRLEVRRSLEMNAKAVFSAKGVTKVYGQGDVEVHALRGIDLELFESEFVVLLGHSGSGKSTLLNILGGLDQVTAGKVYYRDQELTAATDRELTQYRRIHVGFVFQFYNLIPSLTARENVALVTEISEDPMKPDEALGLVDLGHRLDHFPAQLSGGEQQRVAIARAIAKQPDVLLCDEPTGALDVRTGITVLEAIERVNRELGTTTAVITHNAVIADMANRVISLSDGQITEVKTIETRTPVAQLQW